MNHRGAWIGDIGPSVLTLFSYFMIQKCL